jgi:uncharacterized surface protein with fasciclin (FAS1) repeats
MRRPRSLRVAALSAGLGLVLIGCANPTRIVAVSGEPRQPASPARIPDVLEADPQERFTTLLTCIELAGLTATLDESGPLTLFAPTNSAFTAANIRCEEGATLDDAAKRTLTRTLSQHVVESDVLLTAPEGYDPAKHPRGLVIVGNGRTTLDTLLTDTTQSRVEINGAAKTVTRAGSTDAADIVGDEISAPNGYILAIDRVIVPAEPDAVPPPTTLPRPFE